MNAQTPQAGANRTRRLILTLAPLAVFLALAGLFLMQLGKDASRVPSALIGRPVPEFTLPKLEGAAQPGFATADLKAGKVSVVNIFASWCGPCRDEHPQLMKLATDPKLKAAGVQFIGLNYKDQSANARRFLEQLGNPYTHIGVDAAGRASIDWGVYGV
ncbi:MAG: DsbE family thiol:disulfide interchange protein, partial [Alphaproteobacteria bacterium]|nr:DsbE family thiol:disulfide interchange protein [Alphaproteobacteria bacterium]